MKKQITIGIGIIACVALCAAVWPRSAEVWDLPAEPVKASVIAEIEAQSEETPEILISADTPAPETEPVAESEPPKTEVTAEKQTEAEQQASPTPHTLYQNPHQSPPNQSRVTELLLMASLMFGFRVSDGLLTRAAASEQWSAIPATNSPEIKSASWAVWSAATAILVSRSA